jgi:hypothetical protein
VTRPGRDMRLLVSPTPRADAWREALALAAGAAGYRRQGPDVFTRDGPDGARRLQVGWVVDDTPFDDAPWTGLIVDPGTAAATLAQQLGLAPPVHGWEASRLLARLHDGPGPVLTVEDQPIDLPGLDIRLSPPPVAADGGPAATDARHLAAAFALYGWPAAARIDPALLTYDRAYGGAPGWIDLTGRPRLLAYGPTLWLPPGRWDLTVRIEVGVRGEGRCFSADWGTQTACESLDFRPERRGLYEVNMSFDWTMAAPAEFRLKVYEGCFEGSVRIEELAISRVRADGRQGWEKDI